MIPRILKTFVVAVGPLRHPVCQCCWVKPAVNTVTLGPSHPYGVTYCQSCTNRAITQWSEHLEAEDLRRQELRDRLNGFNAGSS